VDYAEDEYDPAAADGDYGYNTSTKIGLLLLKEEINKPLRRLEDYLNEMPGILDVFGLETSTDHSSFSLWDNGYPMNELRCLLRRFGGAGRFFRNWLNRRQCLPTRSVQIALPPPRWLLIQCDEDNAAD